MKLPVYTLIHDPSSSPDNIKTVSDLLAILPKHIVEPFGSLQSNLLRTVALTAREAHVVEAVAEELMRQKQVVTVALWDLEAFVGGFPEVISRLNECQPVFALFEAQAAVPAGLTSGPSRVRAWLRAQGKRPRGRIVSERILFDGFYKRAEKVRSELGVSIIVGLSPYLVVARYKDVVVDDGFSASNRKVILVSTADLYEYAIAAERTYAVAVAYVCLSALAESLSPRLGFHRDRGCLFDYNENRRSIVSSLTNIHIEDSCKELIARPYRDAVIAMAAVLRDYPRPTKRSRLALSSSQSR